MFRKQMLCLMLCCCTLLGCIGAASGAEVDCNDTYCFTQGDFSEDASLAGICVTGLPDPKTGTVMLGTRVIRTGDILTAQQVSAMTFVPLLTETDAEAIVTYLPIYEDRVETATTMTLSIRGRKNEAPVAEDQAIETYKNLTNTAPLKASDPEGEAMTYTVIRQSRRGAVTIDAHGNFTYTPKKNKVGTDSFTYTATDASGNVSREATVTVTILKPTNAPSYTDTAETGCRFEAEWLKHTGIFAGESLGGKMVFHPEQTVSRGEFLSMAVQVLGIPVDEELTAAAYEDEIPVWLQPYLAAALRSGLTAGWTDTTFHADKAITGGEAAVMLQNALDLSVSVAALEALDENVPTWAAQAVAAMMDKGITISVGEELTRAQAAVLLYQIHLLAEDAPGMQMYQ